MLSDINESCCDDQLIYTDQPDSSSLNQEIHNLKTSSLSEVHVLQRLRPAVIN